MGGGGGGVGGQTGSICESTSGSRINAASSAAPEGGLPSCAGALAGPGREVEEASVIPVVDANTRPGRGGVGDSSL